MLNVKIDNFTYQIIIFYYVNKFENEIFHYYKNLLISIFA